MLLRTRTIEAGGSEVDTFTDRTRPTTDEVVALIDQAVDEVLGQLPDDLDPETYPAVRSVISVRGAVLIELSFYRETVQSGGPASALNAMYDAGLAALQMMPLRLR